MQQSFTAPVTTKDIDRQYAVYVFRTRDSLPKKPPFHLSWQRDSLSPTIEAALTRAAMASEQEDVKRVQVYEILTDETGATHTGRIVKTLGVSLFKQLFKGK